MNKTAKSIRMIIPAIFGCIVLFQLLSIFFTISRAGLSAKDTAPESPGASGQPSQLQTWSENDRVIDPQEEAMEREALSRYDYYLDRYNVHIRVFDDNTLEITETIDAYFMVKKHGIFRKIPLRNTVVRQDGTRSTNRAVISDIFVNENYTLSTESGNRIIKIGDADVTLLGLHTYIIQYTYDLGKDTGKNYDELYYNLIGDQWDTAIRNVSFTIEMPKSFDASALGFSHGRKGSTDSSDVYCRIDENTITGYYDGVLSPKEGLTVRLELPEGYFANARSTVDYIWMAVIVLPILFFIISFILWWIYGKDERAVETVEFYPPEDFNSAETGMIYKGKADTEEVVSLLIYLANQGYLKIEEIQEKSLFSIHTSYKIIQLKERYTGSNINERLFFEGLFKTGFVNPETGLMEVTQKELDNSFYQVKNKIVKNLNSKENKRQLFESNTSAKRVVIILMLIATYVMITLKPLADYGSGPAMMVVALVFPGIAIAVIALMFASNSGFTRFFGLVWGLGFGGIPWCATILFVLMQDTAYIYPYVSGILCIIGMIVCFVFMPKRTPYGTQLLGRIKGFKNFLETAEKDRLETLVAQDPSYFYNILPYTYVLDVSDKWIKQFENIALESPDWYQGTAAFTMASFGGFMTSAMASAKSSMASSPSSSGGGGSSGGGSSGGGSGGGGGGSW